MLSAYHEAFLFILYIHIYIYIYFGESATSSRSDESWLAKQVSGTQKTENTAFFPQLVSDAF